MRTLSRIGLVAALLALIALPAFAQSAQVRVIHASPDAPAVDILVNDEIRAFENVPFGEISSYASLAAGVYNFKVVPTGAGPESAVIDVDVNLLYFKNYTVIATDVLENITPVVLEDSTLPALPNRARLRIFHGSPDAPPVDVKVADGPFLAQNLAFQEAQDYVVVPATTVDVEIYIAGTDQLVFTVPAATLTSGANFSAYAVGFAIEGEPGFDVLLSQDPGELPFRVRTSPSQFRPGLRR